MKMVDTVTQQLIVPSHSAENHTLHPTGTLARQNSYSEILSGVRVQHRVPQHPFHSCPRYTAA